MPVPVEQIQRLAGFELNMLRAGNVIGEKFENIKVPSTGTPIYDINGTPLFYRLPLRRGSTFYGYADIAANEVLGEPLLAVSTGQVWDEKEILEEADAMAAQRGVKFDGIRFVAYSFPKIALQYLLDGQEVLMLEWKSWAEVQPQSIGRKQMEPSFFERWSLIDEMPARTKEVRSRSFKERRVLQEATELRNINTNIITKEAFKQPDQLELAVRTITREVHYSPRNSDHYCCYELRGQQTPVWCVAASTEMLLNFYRYQYNQPRLAQEMGLGTCVSPNGLPYGQEHRVVNAIETLSSNTLNATAIPDPTWATFRAEIQADRPLISFIPGHSRTVVGYTYTYWLSFPIHVAFRGLLVYDPWPPTDCSHPEDGGVITRWENFATQTYRYAFTAVLNHV